MAELRKEKKGLELMNGYIEDCKEYIDAWDEANNKIELLTIQINNNEIKSLIEKKQDLKESLKSSIESKQEILEKLWQAEIEHWNQIYSNWDFEERVWE